MALVPTIIHIHALGIAQSFTGVAGFCDKTSAANGRPLGCSIRVRPKAPRGAAFTGRLGQRTAWEGRPTDAESSLRRAFGQPLSRKNPSLFIEPLDSRPGDRHNCRSSAGALAETRYIDGTCGPARGTRSLGHSG